METQKKFEFTGETKLWFGTTFNRIRALVKIETKWGVVNPGDEGGWIEKESNLSQEDNAWVYGDAEVRRSTHYLVMGPMGSRNAHMTFFRDKEGTIKVVCGCFYGDIHAFLEKVTQTHGDSKHARVYRAAVQVALEQIDTEPIKEENLC